MWRIRKISVCCKKQKRPALAERSRKMIPENTKVIQLWISWKGKESDKVWRSLKGYLFEFIQTRMSKPFQRNQDLLESTLYVVKCVMCIVDI